MKKRILGLGLALSLALTGCSGDPDAYRPADDQDEPVVTEPVENPPDEESPGTQTGPQGLMAIGERYELNGKIESYLTGEWIDAEIAARRPMAVMIPNNRNSLPQYGVSYADIIYEAPMEKCSCTRLMGIFQNYGDLEYIEPIRSSRHYFLLEALSYDAIYCNWGLAAAYVGPLINSDLVDNVSASVAGIDVAADEAFSRDRERQQLGYSLEYTGVMSLEGYNAAVSRLGYSTDYPTSDYTFPLQFATEAFLAEYEDYSDITTIYPGGDHNQGSPNGYSELNPYFVYNPEDHLYYRYQNGEPHMDEYNGEQLAVTNVIIKFVSGNALDDMGYMNFNVFGMGEGILFTNGKCVPLTWYRDLPFNEDLDFDEGVYEQTRYYDAETGDEVILNRGRTWICLVWDEYANYTKYF
ncbi:MAG: DUF3048 domain-containing protein [Lachnospiraceae bacterium]|nr:DUF3048 domain-containing protein [Lachnospiraceae bacterium]